MVDGTKAYTEAVQPLTISADIERLNSRIDALREQLKIYDERFSRVNEEIGELRSMLITKEQEIKEIESKTIKAYDTVMSISPENFLKKLAEIEHKLEGLFQKNESSDYVQNQVLKEFKEIKASMMTFRGVKEIIELNEDVKLELENIKKIEANIEKHSDKVEGIFIKLSKNFQEFYKVKELSDNIIIAFKEIVKNLEKVGEGIKLVQNHEKSEEIKEIVDEEIDKSVSTINTLENYKTQMNDLLKKIDDIKLKKEIIQEEKEKEEIGEEIEKMEINESKIEKEEKSVEADIAKIKKLISKSMEDLKNKKKIEAQKKYLEINELYNSLKPEMKKKIYPKIKELYYQLRAKKKNSSSYRSSDVYDIY